jgi:hypothetical protein
MLDSPGAIDLARRLRQVQRNPESSGMPRQFSGSSITVSFSASRSLIPGWMAQHIAAASGITGIDVDAASPLGAWLAARNGSRTASYVPIRSIWIPLHGLRSSRTQRLMNDLVSQHQAGPPRIVTVVPASSSLRTLARDLQPAQALSESWPLAIGLPPSSLRGGRPHLVFLGGLRRFAEEWDFSIAVDLSRNFDPTWEAEAAIARLGERLSVLRVRSSAPSRGAVGQDRVACRAIHAAIDRGRVVDFAVCPGRMSLLPITPQATVTAARQAADYIAERAAVHAEALRDGIDHFEGSRSSRGS